MIYILLLALALASSNFIAPSIAGAGQKIEQDLLLSSYIHPIVTPLSEIKALLEQQSHALHPAVIHKVLTALECAHAHQISHKQILTVIDYSLPSNQKRFWVFDLGQKKLLFHTYVSHGITSGTLVTDYFSNKNNSKASSIGVYKTAKSYYGREGLSLRLQGLDRGFNDNAEQRAIVMHGGWYLDEGFIKRYGRPGRSWGCPALPLDDYKPIINAIKDDGLMVVYYPSEAWFGHSKFLTCDKANQHTVAATAMENASPSTDTSASRDEIVFAQLGNANKREGNDPVLVMSANRYEQVFHTQAPLSRMLRRQIDHQEYIALSMQELQQLVSSNNREGINALGFVIPDLVMVNGYYETQMKLLPVGAIKEIGMNASAAEGLKTYTVYFEGSRTASLAPTNRFIRWVGL